MIHPFVLFFLGLVIGVITGFFGIGGGFLLTPTMNIFGLQMVHAIGTGFFAIMSNSLFGVLKHYRFGNVDLRLGIIVGTSSIVGVDFGKKLILYLEKLNLAGTYVRVVYIILLVLISIFIMGEYYHSHKTKQNGQEGKTIKMQERKSTLSRKIHGIGLPPKISLPHSGVNSMSIWVLCDLSFFICSLLGLLGVGGGFIALPLIIYVIGVPTTTAVGTTLIIVFLTSCYGTAIYAFAGYVEWRAALIILGGSLIGVQIGAPATKYVSDMRLKILFALLLFFVAISILLKQIQMDASSRCLVVISSCLLCLSILFPLRKNLLAQSSSKGKPNSRP